MRQQLIKTFGIYCGPDKYLAIHPFYEAYYSVHNNMIVARPSAHTLVLLHEIAHKVRHVSIRCEFEEAVADYAALTVAAVLNLGEYADMRSHLKFQWDRLTSGQRSKAKYTGLKTAERILDLLK